MWMIVYLEILLVMEFLQINYSQLFIVNNTKFIESSGGVYSATKALNVIVANTEFINCNLGVNKNGRTVYLTGLIAVSDIFISSSSIP